MLIRPIDFERYLSPAIPVVPCGPVIPVKPVGPIVPDGPVGPSSALIFML
jgi:hypothetical protein